MDNRYEKICVLPTEESGSNNDVSIAAGALLYDTMTQSKLIQLKLQNNSTHTLTGVLVKCVLYGENRETVLGETFYQYEGLHVASGEAFGEQTPIVIQTQDVQSFDVVIVNETFEDVAEEVIEPESEQANRQIMQNDSESAFVRMDAEPSGTTQMMDNAPKKKFSLKWLIAGAVLVGALLFAVLGSGFGDPAVGYWKIGDIYNNMQGMELHIKGSGRYTLGMKGEDPIAEGKWERNKVADKKSDEETMQYYTYYSEEGYRLGMFAHIDYSDTIALTIDNDDTVLIFQK